MKTNCINNISFGAKFSTCDLSNTNTEIFKLFKERTSEYPHLTFKHNQSSTIGDDHFIIIGNNKILGEKSASFSNNIDAYPTVEDKVNRFVRIFKSIINETIKH